MSKPCRGHALVSTTCITVLGQSASLLPGSTTRVSLPDGKQWAGIGLCTRLALSAKGPGTFPQAHES